MSYSFYFKKILAFQIKMKVKIIRMDILFLLLMLLSGSEAGEPPNLEDNTESSVNKDSAVNKTKEESSEEPPINITSVAPEPEPKNVTEETIESIVLPEAGSAAKEHSSSLAIFFLLLVLILCIFLIHVLLRIKFHYLPESLAIGKQE